MRLPFMKPIKFMFITGILGILFMFTGSIRFGIALLMAAGIFMVATVILWLKWILNL